VVNAKVLFDSAKRAGVKRLIHISIINSDRASDLSYFRCKAEMEEHVKETGLSQAVLRPAVLFGKEDILINNRGQLCRRFENAADQDRWRWVCGNTFARDAAPVA